MTIKIDIEKEHGNKLQFSLSNCSVAFANGLRRYASMRIPVLAIDTVTFYENNSSLFDEYIAHRLGMMPVTTPDKLPEEAEVSFMLDEVGPKTIYAKDMKSSDKEIHIGKENIPVITLIEHQKLKLEAKAVLGVGNKHAKFQSGIVSYEIAGNKFIFRV